MLKLRCGWELPDELQLVLDPTGDGFNEDDLMSPDATVLVTVNRTSEGYRIEIFEDGVGSEHDTEAQVADYLEFLKVMDKHGYAPAKFVLRSYKLDSLLSQE